ncbi:CBS domain-containing protein [Sphingomonas sp.]|jgi:CBS domain-containing protein|uniref:CBS domain-containing protein n=1 Tax=Sphingomonas sp. TaxID=28214 RepID=UPI002ED9ADF1
MTIGAILKDKGGEVVSLASTATVREAVALLAERRIGAVPVVDGEGEARAVAGIFSERDVTYCLAREGAAALDRLLSEVMTSPVQTVTSAEPVIGALSLMTKRRIRHLPVCDGGRIVGFVSIGDLVKHRIDRIEADAAAMRDYIQQA